MYILSILSEEFLVSHKNTLKLMEIILDAKFVSLSYSTTSSSSNNDNKETNKINTSSSSEVLEKVYMQIENMRTSSEHVKKTVGLLHALNPNSSSNNAEMQQQCCDKPLEIFTIG